MKWQWEIFEELREYFYVVDFDTDETIFINKFTRERLGLSSKSDYFGKKSYDVLGIFYDFLGKTSRALLKENEFIEKYFYYEPLNQHIYLKDTIQKSSDGHCYRFQIAIQGIKDDKTAIQSYQALEANANEGIRMALKETDSEAGINILLEYMGHSLRAGRTYIFERNEKGNDDNTYEWCADGVFPVIDTLQDLDASVCANWYRSFSESKNIVIYDLEDIKESDPLQYENLYAQDIHSLVVVPLYDGGKVIGFYGVDNPPIESIQYAENMLKILGYFMVSSIRRRNLLNQLQKISNEDALTGLKNRHALNSYMQNLKADGGIGVVYADITGLKRVNDNEGHLAGDQLILRAAKCFSSAFKDYMVFRIGGDELLAVCSPISKEKLEQNADLLRKSTESHNVNLAVGTVWQENGKVDMDLLLSVSEKEMYKEKSAYYKRTGIERRR